MWPLFLSSSYFAREPRGISTKTSTWSGVGFAGIRSPSVTVGGRDDDRDLPLRALGSIPSGEVSRRSAHEGLVHLRELARDDDARVRRERGDVGEKVAGPVRALVDDDGPALRDETLEERAALTGLLRDEAEEGERARRQSGRDERRDGRVRSGDRRHRVARGDRRGDERLAGIGERGRARVG